MKRVLPLVISVSGCSFFPSYQTPFTPENPLISGSLDREENAPLISRVAHLQREAADSQENAIRLQEHAQQLQDMVTKAQATKSDASVLKAAQDLAFRAQSDAAREQLKAEKAQIDAQKKQKELEGVSGKSSKTNFKEEKAQSWIDSYREVKRQPSNAGLVNYVGTGITYSQLICRDYFERLARTKAHRQYAQKESNLTGGLAASLMGLAKASAGAIAGTSAAFSFGSASFDAYDTSFLVAPDIADLEQLVQAKQVQEELIIYRKLYATNSKWPEAIETVDQADRVLNGYIYICTYNGIRNLLNDSIKSRTHQAEGAVEVIQKAPAQEKSSVLQIRANQPRN